MGFLEQVSTARDALRAHGRVSMRGLGRELGIEGDELEEIVEELVDIQQVAKRDGKALVWIDGGNVGATSAATQRSIAPEGAPTRRSYTPRHLAEKILANRSAMEGEKKHVTVLFCDVADSMGLANALGPEAWHETLNEFFGVLTSAVHEHEGTVNQYTGDGVMALFGAPIAAEDHARRACSAALEIQEKLGALGERIQAQYSREFKARIGLNSGEVVVGKIGDDLRMDYTAQGQVVGVAARLEALAEPGTVLLSQRVAKQVEGFFELQPQGTQALKGVAEPVELFKLGAAKEERSRLDVARERGFSTFVGRDAEMAVLRQALKRSLSGQGQVVSIVAPPGVGKSRLCWEFEQECRAQGVDFLVSRGQSHVRMAPLQAFQHNSARLYGFKPDDTAEEKRRKIRAQLEESGKEVEPSRLAVAYDYCSCPDPNLKVPPVAPEMRRRQFRDATIWGLRRYTRMVGGGVTLFEDAQWFDETSLSVLDHWIEIAQDFPVLLILNYRSDFEPPWRTRESHMQRIALQPLDLDAVKDMLSKSLGSHPSLGGLEQRIIEASGGNPFFIEEMVRSLEEQGEFSGSRGDYRLEKPVDQLPLPESVQAVLAARIDRLAPMDKEVLQSASVIGRTFDPADIARWGYAEEDIRAGLERLRSADFVYAKSGGRYSFKHALTQDVAYGSLLQSRRAELHRDVARGLESFKDPSEQQLIWLAQHWEKAGDLEQAALATHRAAKAVQKKDVRESLQLRREFLRLERALPKSSARLRSAGVAARSSLLEWAGLQSMTSDEARTLYEEGCALAKAAGDEFRLVNLQLAYGMRLQNEARLLEAIEIIEGAAGKLEKIPSPAVQIPMNGVFRGWVYGPVGFASKCLAASEKALALLDKHPELEFIGGANQRTSARVARTTALGVIGRLPEALVELKDIGSNAGTGDLFTHFADGWYVFYSWWAGNREGLQEPLERADRQAREGIGPWWDSSLNGFAAVACAMQGDLQRALVYIDRGLEASERNDGLALLRAWQRPWRGLILAQLGRREECLATFRRNDSDLDLRGVPVMNVLHFVTKAVSLRLLGVDVGRREQALAELQRHLDQTEFETARHMFLWERARLAGDKGDAAGYRSGLDEALASAEQVGATGHAAEIRQEIAKVAVA